MKQLLLFLVFGLCMSLNTYAFTGDAKVGNLMYHIITKAKKAEVIKSDIIHRGVLTIPSTITYEGVICDVVSIGDDAFYSDEITSVTIPSSVTSIKFGAFRNCDKLRKIVIPDGVTTVESSIFENCDVLSSVTFGKSLDRVAGRMFQNCYSLKTITIPENIRVIGESAFSGCRDLQSIELSERLDSICDEAFFECKAMPKIDIPDNVRYIGSNVFKNCVSLKNVKIGFNAIDWGYGTFFGCGNLEELHCYSKFIPNVYDNTFYGSECEYTTLYIPEEFVTDYKSLKPWNTFGTIKGVPNMKIIEKVEDTGEPAQNKAKFPGLVTKQNWIEEKVKEFSSEISEHGAVRLTFIVETDGTLSNFVITSSSDKPQVDELALKIAKMMPRMRAYYDTGKKQYVRSIESLMIKM